MSDQSPKETAKAHAAFVEYCAMGPGRSIRKLAESDQQHIKSVSLLLKWSSEHNWQERVKQYDTERAEERRLARERAREEMELRQAEEAREDQILARRELRLLAEKHRLGSMPAVQYLKNAIEAERKALGADDNTTRVKAEIMGKDGGPVDILTKWNGGSKAGEDKDDAKP